MSRCIVLTPEQQTGKAAFKALAKAFGGQVAVEAEFGVRQQEISDFGLPNVAKFASIDLVDRLEESTVGLPGWPHVTSWLCRRRGGIFVPLPMGSTDADGLVRTVAELGAEFGDVSRAVADAVCPNGPDGEEVTKAEAQAALDALDDLDRVSAQLRMKLSEKLKGE